jgi:hypothetical protein
MAFSGLRGFPRHPHTVGHEDLVGLLEFGGEQTIERIFEANIALA